MIDEQFNNKRSQIFPSVDGRGSDVRVGRGGDNGIQFINFERVGDKNV